MVDTLSELLARMGLSLADYIIFLSRLRESPAWQGHLMTVVLRGADVSNTFPTGLGRAHRGGVVVTSTEPVTAFVLPAVDDVNMTLYVAAAPGVDVTYSVWVF